MKGLDGGERTHFRHGEDFSGIIAPLVWALLKAQLGPSYSGFNEDLKRRVEGAWHAGDDADTVSVAYRSADARVLGWLITPTENYGEAITAANISRLVTAVRDLETLGALA